MLVGSSTGARGPSGGVRIVSCAGPLVCLLFVDADHKNELVYRQSKQLLVVAPELCAAHHAKAGAHLQKVCPHPGLKVCGLLNMSPLQV